VTASRYISAAGLVEHAEKYSNNAADGSAVYEVIEVDLRRVIPEETPDERLQRVERCMLWLTAEWMQITGRSEPPEVAFLSYHEIFTSEERVALRGLRRFCAGEQGAVCQSDLVASALDKLERGIRDFYDLCATAFGTTREQAKRQLIRAIYDRKRGVD
jgi:hypothetical protein